NALRALALITTHRMQSEQVLREVDEAERTDEGALTAFGISDLDYLEACIEEAMRLYPTTPLLSRETLEDVRWNGATVPAGTQVLISNTFNHRDPELDFADRFAPEEWLEGGAAESWQFNQFSHGPQGCPGAWIALFVGKGLLAALLAERRFDLVSGPDLDSAEALPAMLDFFRLRFAVEPRA
ncbi:MAG TPA: cytochrome P450, partial [Solirubrobacterales bacterium]|nr:cytochrome P450 [Solirubrobacterales bacterium]